MTLIQGYSGSRQESLEKFVVAHLSVILQKVGLHSTTLKTIQECVGYTKESLIHLMEAEAPISMVGFPGKKEKAENRISAST